MTGTTAKENLLIDKTGGRVARLVLVRRHVRSWSWDGLRERWLSRLTPILARSLPSPCIPSKARVVAGTLVSVLDVSLREGNRLILHPTLFC
jgi:hypothetical protein